MHRWLSMPIAVSVLIWRIVVKPFSHAPGRNSWNHHAEIRRSGIIGQRH
jgi:hypothetical protein